MRAMFQLIYLRMICTFQTGDETNGNKYKLIAHESL